MRKQLMCGVAMVALMGSWGAVRAADLPQALALPVAAGLVESPTTHDWSGLYVGAHGGFGGANFGGGHELGSNSTGDPAEFAKDLDLTGIAGGFHAGYNYQFDHGDNVDYDIVIGIEGDVSFVDWNDTVIDDSNSEDEGIYGSVDLLASIRGRLGVARDNVLMYATGGLAIPHASFGTILPSDTEGTVKFNGIGGVVGGGVEYAHNDRVSLRVEGLYYFFNERQAADEFSNDDYGEFKNALVGRIGLSVKLGQD